MRILLSTLSLIFMIWIMSCGDSNSQKKDKEEPATSLSADAITKAPAKKYVDVTLCDSLSVYYPHFSRIDLVTGSMPDKSEKNVIFCCAGSFTGKRLSEFRHSNIAGDHVSGGEFFNGYKCGPYNGVFTWSKKSDWRFYNYSYKNAIAPLRKVAQEGGMEWVTVKRCYSATGNVSRVASSRVQLTGIGRSAKSENDYV